MKKNNQRVDFHHDFENPLSNDLELVVLSSDPEKTEKECGVRSI